MDHPMTVRAQNGQILEPSASGAGRRKTFSVMHFAEISSQRAILVSERKVTRFAPKLSQVTKHLLYFSLPQLRIALPSEVRYELRLSFLSLDVLLSGSRDCKARLEIVSVLGPPKLLRYFAGAALENNLEQARLAVVS